MKVKWLAHSCFLITSQGGTRIVTDPYATGSGLSYGQISETADVVTTSHDHFDHNNVGAVKGQPQVVKGVGQHQAGGVEFLGVAAFHDEAHGSARGASTIFAFAVDGVRLCHCGDLGHTLTPEQVAEIG
ncbi:MAG: MBL fold metallo-hydrolase, partial [Dehalococcoidia bacterium]